MQGATTPAVTVSPANHHALGPWRPFSSGFLRWAPPAAALCIALVVFVALVPELRIDTPDLNDSALHLALAVRMDEAPSHSASVLDFWFADVGLGFPVLHHYQPLPYLTLVAVARLLPIASPPGNDLEARLSRMASIHRWSIGVLLALVPLSMYAAMRRLGVDALTSVASAAIAPLLSAPALYGLGFESYLWAGSGLYAQLFASVLAPLAFVESYRAVTSGRRLALAALLVTATFLSQLVYGYIVAASTIVFLVPAGDRPRRAIRVAVLLTVAFLAGAWFFVPALRDDAYANRSVWEEASKWDSIGARAALTHLARGDLFDYRRGVPMVTLLAAIGLGVALRRRDERLMMVASLAVGWFLLYLGRPAWGLLIDILPLAREVPLHRFIGGVHLFAIPLAAFGLAAAIRACHPERSWARLVMSAIVASILLAPAARERASYLAWSAGLKAESKTAVDRDSDLRPLLTRLQHLDGGRVFVGVPKFPDLMLKAGSVPLSALLLTHGIDSLGPLWHSMSPVGDVQLWFDPYDEMMCRTFGVRYLVMEAARRPPPFARSMATIGRYRIDEVESASYAGVADVPVAVEVPQRRAYDVGMAWLRSRLGDDGIYPALAMHGREPPGLDVRPFDPIEPGAVFRAPALSPGPPGRVTAVVDRWTQDVTLERPGAAILRANFHPGLQATVDGQPVRAFPVAPGLAAVHVPTGRHVVRFAYQSATHWPLMILGLVALVAAGPASDRLVERVTALPRHVRWSPLTTRIATVVVLAIVAGRPLLQTRELAGHDSIAYLTQLAEFDHALRDGQFPPRWAPDFDFGRGTPFFVFQPPLFLWVAEGFHLLGAGLIASTNLAALSFVIGAALLMFAFVRDRWGDRAGQVAAVAYVFAPYVLLDLYVRHAFLEMSALPWLPLAAWGVSRGAFRLVGAATALLLLSHPGLFPFMVLALLLYAASLRTFLTTMAGLALGIGLAAWFIFPALVRATHLTVGETVATSAFSYTNHFVTMGQLLWSRWGFGLSVPGPGDDMSFRIGLVQIAGLVGVMTWARPRFARSLAGMAAIGIFFSLAISKPIWDALPVIHAVSFPWRALTIAAFAASAAAGVAFRDLPMTATAMALLLGLPIAAPSGYLDTVVNEQFTPSRIARENLRPGTPGYFDLRGVPSQPWSSIRARAIEGDARVDRVSERTGGVELTVVAMTTARIQLEVANFPGWVARVDSRPVTIVPSEGKVAVVVDPGAHVVDAWFERTAIDWWSTTMSLVALIGLLPIARRGIRGARPAGAI